MNLVAKEFVSARDDHRGALVLSRFTGAARELTSAIPVNPYDVDGVADGLKLTLSLPAEEQARRMRAMRSHVAGCNVFRWAGRMLLDAAAVTTAPVRVRSSVRDAGTQDAPQSVALAAVHLTPSRMPPLRCVGAQRPFSR